MYCCIYNRLYFIWMFFINLYVYYMFFYCLYVLLLSLPPVLTCIAMYRSVSPLFICTPLWHQ
ncbi:hypothetical protein BC941DRAFT_436255, partial [Chlamydoabsidia padenii]